MKECRNFFIAIWLVALTMSCQETKNDKSAWELIKEKENVELESGIRNDTIFLGFYFGMTKKGLKNQVAVFLKKF